MEKFNMESFLSLIAKDKRCLEMMRYLINNSYTELLITITQIRQMQRV